MAERQRRSTWQVHESTARALCQLTFLLAGILPLALCLYWSAQQFLPTYQRHQAKQWEQWLTAQLGVAVTVAAYESRAPERFALHEIRLNHPETAAAIGRIRLAEVERREGKWAIRLTQPELEGNELPTVWRIAHDWFLCRPRPAAQAARVGMSGLTIHTARGQKHVLRELTMSLLPTPQATLLSLQFRPESQLLAASTEKPMQCIIKRHHTADGLKTELQLRTETHDMPIAMLTGLAPWVERLGPEAKFSGTLDVDLRSDAWQASLIGSHFTKVDLAALTASADARLSGTGQVQFERLDISQRGIDLAYGRGEIRDGSMAAGLFHSLGKYLGVTARETNQVSAYGFEKLEFAIHIRQPSLHLWAQMSDAQGLLAARQQWDQAVPLENVVVALANCTPTAAADTPPSELASLPTTWLSKQALVWLPLGDPQWQAAQAQLRLSSLPTTVGQ